MNIGELEIGWPLGFDDSSAGRVSPAFSFEYPRSILSSRGEISRRPARNLELTFPPYAHLSISLTAELAPSPPLPHPPIFAFHDLILIVRIGSDKESGFYLQRGQISPSLSPSLRSEDRALEPTKVFTRRSFCYVGYVSEGKGGGRDRNFEINEIGSFKTLLCDSFEIAGIRERTSELQQFL